MRSAVKLGSGRMRRSVDQRSMAEGFSYPGIDPRQWLSYATVDTENPVVFDAEYGPLIACTLQPSKVQVTCRVAMQIAGNGEGEYSPFIAGDEVLVAIPEGNERSDCAIIGRFTNAIDKFPMESVAGQDPTTNSFAFQRRRTPFIQEYAGPIMLRSALSEAFIAIDARGAITLRDGAKGALQMSADVLGYQSGDSDGKFMLQLDLAGGRFTLRVDDALFVLSSSSASPQTSTIRTPGAFQVMANEQPPNEHVITTEAIGAVLDAWQITFMTALTAAWAPIVTPIAGAPLGPVLTAALAAVFNPAVLAAAFTTASAGALNPAVGAAIFGAFQSTGPKPPAVPGTGQARPGIGCVGFLSG